MLQFDDLRGRLSGWNPRAQWVQLGLLSASIMAPLVGRWNELRAAERARAVREEAEARLSGLRMSLPWQRNDPVVQVTELLKQRNPKVNEKLAARANLSTRLWLIGVCVGLVMAGAGAYMLVRRRMERSAEEPLVDLPIDLPVSSTPYGRSIRNGYNGASLPTSPSRGFDAAAPASVTESTGVRVAGSGLPTLGDGTPADVKVRPDTWSSATTAPERNTAEQTSADMSTPADDAGAADMDYMEIADRMPYIGNIRTMIFHDSDADNLPAEENRIYFASEEEARDAGYRRDRDEVSPAEPETQSQTNA